MPPTPYIPSIAIDTVIEAVSAFLQPFMGEGVPIVRGQQNRVAPPAASPAYAVLTEVLQVDLETPTANNDSVNSQVDLRGPKRIDIQCDIYGEGAGDIAAAVKGVFRSGYAVSQFPDGIAPLYCSDGIQAPLITGEEQYEFHWILTQSYQYNPIVAIPIQSADELAVHEIVIADLLA